MSDPNFPKVIKVTFSGSATNDPVTITNNTTGERVYTDHAGNLLRLESKTKTIVYDLRNLSSGWSVGDIITVSVGGTKAGSSTITLTAAKNAPQTKTVTAGTASTSVLTI